MERSIKNTIILIAIFSIIAPFLIELFILRNKVVTVVSNEAWLSFIASFYGAIIGGIATLIAVFSSIKQTNDIQKKEDEIREFDRIESIKPIFTFPIDDKKVDIKVEREQYEKGETLAPYYHYNIIIENIGMGIAYDFISYYKSGDNARGEGGERIFIQKGEQISIQIAGHYNFNKDSKVEEHVKLDLAYKDLNCNLYKQKMEYTINFRKGLIVSRRVFIPELAKKRYKHPTKIYK